MAGSVISKILGYGSYKIKSNSLLNGGPPQFGDMKNGFRVRHREYIQDIQSSTSFTTYSFPIQPGLSNLFPWLSQVAQNFEEYRIHGLVVYLNSTSGDAIASTNTALGVWGAVTVYNPADPLLGSKSECENYIGAQSTKPSSSLIHGIECAPKSNVLDRFFLREGAISGDLQFYDLGFIQIFTSGAQSVSTIGEMWVSYDVELIKPKLPQGGYNTSSATLTGSTTVNSTTFLPPVTQSADAGSNLAISLISGVLNIPQMSYPAQYLISYNGYVGAGYGSDVLSLGLTTTNASGVPILENNGYTSLTDFVVLDKGLKIFQTQIMLLVNAGASVATLQLGSWAVGVTLTNYQIVVNSFDSNVTAILKNNLLTIKKREDEEEEVLLKLLSKLKKSKRFMIENGSSSGSDPPENIGHKKITKAKY
jgi:hypothetical protein